MPDKTINVTVLVDEKHRTDLAKVAKELKKHGFRLAVSNDEIGVLSGSVDETAKARLEGVQGVSAVEEERDDYRTQE